MQAEKAKDSFKVDDKGTTNHWSSLRAEKHILLVCFFSGNNQLLRRKNINKEEKEKLMEKKRQYWDTLRKNKLRYW